ncbi:phosphonate metabolism protein/1,5-bisphosphokinase (PRPP-forming) PhnN [Aquidulcibacter sp.]|uniref:phosphonate metabolism protein/1,5-bisphosphokinase (PRPP-forming) PhnN n=1 Tax=Aquidulcibacter sp. TaxID=2052990 RepID=UPI003BA57A28
MTGTLFLIVGPSGVGKDSLIEGAKAQLSADPTYYFPQRFITRPQDAGGEDHFAVEPSVFEDKRQRGDFALFWNAHGLSYGVPADISARLKRGQHVVVNVSRAILDEARQRFSPLVVVSITAPSKVIEQRLTARGRETAPEIADRIARAAAYDVTGPGVIFLNNDASLDAGVSKLVEILEAS